MSNTAMDDFNFKPNDIAIPGRERYSTMSRGARSVFVSVGATDNVRVSDMQPTCGAVLTYTAQQARALARELLAAADAIAPEIDATGARMVAGNEAMIEAYDEESGDTLVTVDGTVLAVAWHDEGGRGALPCVDAITHGDLTLTAYELSSGYVARVRDALEDALDKE